MLTLPGDAYFYGLSVRQDLDAVHTILGVCPQHDILWGDLTAQEHMELFANLKAIPADRMADDIRVLLEEVQLLNVRNSVLTGSKVFVKPVHFIIQWNPS